MNKRLFFIYTTVFILTGLMLYLYRASYRDMKVFIQDVNRMSGVVVKLERLDALLHFWLNNDRMTDRSVDLYLSPDDAYDSILNATDYIKEIVLYQEDRLRMDTIRMAVRNFQRVHERSDTMLTQAQKEEFRRSLKAMLQSAFASANKRLDHSKLRLEESTALIDRWLVWMLVLAGSLITIATFYSFNFLRQRQKAEGFSRALLEITNNGMISFQPSFTPDGTLENYRVTFCNEAGLKLLNLKDWRGIGLTDILPPKVLPDVQKVFDAVLSSRQSRILEGYLQHDQERKWLQAMVTPLHEGLFVSIYNLTPEKTYQQRLTYKINQLKLLNDELQQYAYVTSHDLQEPLRKIQMFSDIALNSTADEEGKTKDDYFRRIQSIASHMRELIQTLLAFTRSTDQAGQLERVDLNSVLAEVVEELDIRDTRASIDLTDLPAVEGSRLHFKLLFTNLLNNAVKYAKPGVPLRIAVYERKAGHHDYIAFPLLDQFVRYTRITVKDNGVGFQPHLSEKVFTIFQRLYNKESAPGTGIGLAICKKIVHQHNGYMYAEGSENEGASFHIFLPLEQPPGSD
jgi:signal transduction histidine kinase